MKREERLGHIRQMVDAMIRGDEDASVAAFKTIAPAKTKQILYGEDESESIEGGEGEGEGSAT